MISRGMIQVTMCVNICQLNFQPVFLEDLIAAIGSLSDPESARAFILSAIRLSDQNFVALITGATKSEERECVFAGFNTPLLPEVLICTSVGQEGIDLHRHCRYVIHYDLAWNPAVLEQRTGRADRIGSKTFRERTIALQQSNQRISLFFITTDASIHVRLQAPRQQFQYLGFDVKIVERFGARVKEILNGFSAPIEKVDTEAFRIALNDFIIDLDEQEGK